MTPRGYHIRAGVAALCTRPVVCAFVCAVSRYIRHVEAVFVASLRCYDVRAAARAVNPVTAPKTHCDVGVFAGMYLAVGRRFVIPLIAAYRTFPVFSARCGTVGGRRVGGGGGSVPVAVIYGNVQIAVPAVISVSSRRDGTGCSGAAVIRIDGRYGQVSYP